MMAGWAEPDVALTANIMIGEERFLLLSHVGHLLDVYDFLFIFFVLLVNWSVRYKESGRRET